MNEKSLGGSEVQMCVETMQLNKGSLPELLPIASSTGRCLEMNETQKQSTKSLGG